jgi:hypothetical protein
MRILVALIVFLTPAAALAQIALEQRRADFQQLAAFVAKSYAPYEWKRDALGFDAFRLEPWYARIDAARDDLEFFEVMMEYVASLQDLHSGYFLPSTFVASLPFAADLYDGRPLIDSIDRARLPESRYPFQIGDELVSIDGQPAGEWIDRVVRLQSFANPRATRRWALDQITFREQAVIPKAAQMGERAIVAVKRRTSGAIETYSMPWETSGTPLERIGPVPTPMESASAANEAARVSPLRVRRAPAAKRLRGFGSITPVFDLPANFSVRLGVTPGDLLYSGSYSSQGLTIGFLRIPAFPLAASAQARMLRQLDAEVAWFLRNAGGLVLDVMRNPGGDTCLMNEILLRFNPAPFRTVGDEIRPTLELVEEFRLLLEDALFSGDELAAAYRTLHLRDIETAYSEYRGRTGPLPVCGNSMDLYPESGVATFDKPIVALIDDFSTSAADAFPAVLQDAGRAVLFGMPSAGGGGLSFFKQVGFYSEGSASLSFSLGVRPRTVEAPGLPPANYIENIGARPDITVDYMTEANLLEKGRPFVDAFTAAMVRLLRPSEEPAKPDAGGARLHEPRADKDGLEVVERGPVEQISHLRNRLPF